LFSPRRGDHFLRFELRELDWSQRAEARMRTYLVEVSPPFFDQNLCLGARTKPFEAQTLVAKLAVEALGDAILPRRIDVRAISDTQIAKA